ncbi:uncharacterized protein LOC135218808 [Macrobrachium nipponense]|uniref:uncharacterized protein LOC135218808 n=1 Tax=Macrobrachium nipponense TaxID=159736 RepID=UPI0030C7B001
MSDNAMMEAGDILFNGPISFSIGRGHTPTSLQQPGGVYLPSVLFDPSVLNRLMSSQGLRMTLVAPLGPQAEWFPDLLNKKRLSVSVIRSYRAALSLVLWELSLLVKGFEQSSSPRELKPQTWDVSLVLKSFTKSPYEPLHCSSDWNLMLKAIFFLALASSKRVGELHDLSYEVKHTRGWGSLSFEFVLEFVAKTQSTSAHDDRFISFSIPSLNDLWVVMLKSVRAHDVKGIGPSLAFKKNLAVHRGLSAGTWLCQSTFASFYLKDVSHRSADTFFLGKVWIYLLACIVGWGLSLWLFQKARSQFSGKPAVTLNWATFFSWAVILQVPLSRQPADFISQTLIGWWLLVSFVIATAYRSSLIAHLAVQSKTTPIDSFEDMIRQTDWKWGAEAKMFTGAVVAYFQTTTDPIAAKVHKHLQKLSEEDALQKVLRGGFSYMHWYNHISSVIQSYTDHLGVSPFYIGQKGTTILTDFGWGFRKGAPYKDRFNLMTNRLIEAGIISHWTSDIMASRVKENGKLRDKNQAHNTIMYHENIQIILHLSHLTGVFLLLLLGYALACLILLSEVMIVKWQKKKTTLFFMAQSDEGP